MNDFTVTEKAQRPNLPGKRSATRIATIAP